jgi:hypothetical protein
MSRQCKICSHSELEKINNYMIVHRPTFAIGKDYCESLGLIISEPTLANHCYKHIEGFEKKLTHKLDNVENYGGLGEQKLVTIPHSFDIFEMRKALGIDEIDNKPDTVKSVITRSLFKSIELTSLSLVNALLEHSKGMRDYPLEMIRGLKDLIVICDNLTNNKERSGKYKDVLDIENINNDEIDKERAGGLSPEMVDEIREKILGIVA